MEHAFEIFYDPIPGRELDKEIHYCTRCGLEMEEPQDLYPVPEVNEGMEADEWMKMMGYEADCDVQMVRRIHES